MNTTEHLLTCLAEECGEIIQTATKALRFGLDGSYSDGTRNDAAIVRELNDLLGVLKLACEAGILPNDWVDEIAIMAKAQKVKQHMELAEAKARGFNSICHAGYDPSRCGAGATCK